MKTFADISGKRFGRLVAIERVGQNKRGYAVWRCRCDCGKEATVSKQRLVENRTKSCGCLRDEMAAKTNLRHGLRHTRPYKVWHNMKRRCYSPNEPIYKYYGGRGISVCEERRTDFLAFYIWAKETGYDETAPRGDCTLDRIDNNGDYEPANCRWADMMTQAHNKRVNAWI